MKIWSILSPERIFLNIPLSDKEAVLRYISGAFARIGAIKDSDKLYTALKNREEMMSTGIGGGIGIPHVLTPDVDDVTILFIRPEKPVPFQALDNKPVDIIIPLIVPQNETTLHLRTLAGISGLCKKPGFLKYARKAKGPEIIWEEIKKIEGL